MINSVRKSLFPPASFKSTPQLCVPPHMMVIVVVNFMDIVMLTGLGALTPEDLLLGMFLKSEKQQLVGVARNKEQSHILRPKLNTYHLVMHPKKQYG